MLKDQYFIEVLVSILKNLLMKHEFELFARKKDKFLDKLRESTSKMSSPRRTTVSRKTASPSRMSMSPRKELDRFRYLEFIKKKMDFCEELYRLLAEIAENYPEAQNEIYNLVPNFQLHAKYLICTSECIRKIIGNNWYLLNKINKSVKFSFDFSDPETEKFNVLINIIDKEKNDAPLKFSKQDKLTSKPMNLINYYMNLIWDGESTIKQEYMRFLRCLCKFGERGININQEMIFKLYNCMVMARRSNPFVHARV